MLSYGWNGARSVAFAPHHDASLVPARVVRPDRGACTVVTESGTLLARLGAALPNDPIELPTVGDWVAVAIPDDSAPRVEAVLPRTSAFVRHAAGSETAAHVLAANVDTVFVVVPLNKKVNLSRIERFMTLAWESGALPALVLTKADLCDDVPAAVNAAAGAAPGVAVIAVSSVTGDGLSDIAGYVMPGQTVVLLGQSGAGKSTLLNALAGGELMMTREIRADGRGRHTTTHRELVLLPGGGVLIDTPGLRTLLLWHAEEGLEKAFDDVEAFFGQCRFSDCVHDCEPGCAVQAAISEGALPQRRFDSYRKLQQELEFLARKQDKRLAAQATKAVRVESRYRRKNQKVR